MRSKKLFIGLRAALAMFAVALLAASASAATEKKLHNFGNGTDGASPAGRLIIDAAGNLYGTTARAAITAAGRCSSCRPMGAEAGRRRSCITSAYWHGRE